RSTPNRDLKDKSIGRLQQKDVLWLLSKDVIAQTGEQPLGGIPISGDILGPDQKDFRTGHVFPTDHQIGTKLYHGKVGVPKTEIHRPVQVFSHPKVSVLQSELSRIIGTKAVPEPFGRGIGYGFEIPEPAPGDKGLPPILYAQV